jgi:hypothetical protein
MAWSTSHAQGVLSRWPDPSLRDVKLAYRKDTLKTPMGNAWLESQKATAETETVPNPMVDAYAPKSGARGSP